MPVDEAYKELGIAYNTAYKIYSQDKTCNIPLCIKGGYEVSRRSRSGYFGGKKRGKRGRGAEGKSKIPVFGILERQGKVKVEVVKDVSCELLMGDDKEGKEGKFNLHRQI